MTKINWKIDKKNSQSLMDGEKTSKHKIELKIELPDNEETEKPLELGE